jgi:hypothetical protein
MGRRIIGHWIRLMDDFSIKLLTYHSIEFADFGGNQRTGGR